MKDPKAIAVVSLLVAVAGVVGSFMVPEVRRTLGLESSAQPEPQPERRQPIAMPRQPPQEPKKDTAARAEAGSPDPYEQALLEVLARGVEAGAFFDPRRPEELRRAVASLRQLRSRLAIPAVVRLLESWSVVRGEDAPDLLIESIAFLEDLKATEACPTLARVSLMNSSSGDRAASAADKLCKGRQVTK